jgi:hypothetical protein
MRYIDRPGKTKLDTHDKNRNAHSDEVLFFLKKEIRIKKERFKRSTDQRDLNSMAVLLIDNLLRLFLLVLEESANPSQRLLRQNQAGSDSSLSRSEDTIAAALLVLRAIHIEEVVLHVAGDTDGQRGPVIDGATQFLGVLLDDREAVIDLSQALVTERVGTGQVGSEIAVGRGEVGQHGFGKTVVALVGEFKGLGSVGVSLVVGDGVGDDGVGGEMLYLECLSQWTGSGFGCGGGSCIHQGIASSASRR